jgi:hypothetical protein
MGERIPKWGIGIDDNWGSFLLGANINIGKWNKHRYGYLCIYLGFKTLVIGKDVTFDKDKEED